MVNRPTATIFKSSSKNKRSNAEVGLRDSPKNKNATRKSIVLLMRNGGSIAVVHILDFRDTSSRKSQC